MTIKVELTDEEVDYIASLMVQWRITSKYEMINMVRSSMDLPEMKVNEEDGKRLKDLFEELCVYEVTEVGINFAKKMLRVNLMAQIKELQEE